jgi:hypothetical protein
MIVDDREAKGRLKELTFEVQRMKEPEEASPRKKALFKTASSFSRCLRLAYTGTGEILDGLKQSIDQLEAADGGNELNAQRVVLLREMWEICVGKHKPDRLKR